jgi:hypothetical protein
LWLVPRSTESTCHCAHSSRVRAQVMVGRLAARLVLRTARFLQRCRGLRAARQSDELQATTQAGSGGIKQGAASPPGHGGPPRQTCDTGTIEGKPSTGVAIIRSAVTQCSLRGVVGFFFQSSASAAPAAASGRGGALRSPPNAGGAGAGHGRWARARARRAAVWSVGPSIYLTKAPHLWGASSLRK